MILHLRIKFPFLKVIAVFARQVANRTDGLQHYIYGFRERGYIRITHGMFKTMFYLVSYANVIYLTIGCHFLPCFFPVTVVIGDKSFAKPVCECLTVIAQDDPLLVETVLDIA